MTDVTLWAAVAAGGALGALVRGGTYHALASSAPGGPAGFADRVGVRHATLAVNLAGSLILGLLAGLYAETPEQDPMQVFWMTGFCGSLTTFSTFCAEAFDLLRRRAFVDCAVYIGLIAVASLGAFVAGQTLAPLWAGISAN